MDIAKINSVLIENDINVDASFVHTLQDGAMVEYQPLLNKIIAKIEEASSYGVNVGFSQDLKKEIQALAKLAKTVTEQKNTKKIVSLENKFNDYAKEAEKLMKKQNEVDVKKEVVKYIDSYTSALEVLKNMDSASNRKKYLDDGILELKKLKQTLENVVDVSTVNAETFAKEIIGLLKTYGNKVSMLMHDSTTTSIVTNAVEVAEKWSKVSVGVTSGLFKKSNKLTSVDNVKYIRDDMYRISVSGTTLEKINIFSDNLKEYSNSVASGKFNVDEDNREIENIKSKIKAFESEKNDTVKQVINGEISKIDGMEICKNIDADIYELNTDLEEIKKTVKVNTYLKRNFDRVIRKLTRINKVVLSYRNEPVMLSYLGEMFSFESAIKVMRGTGTQEDIDSIVNFSTTTKDINNISNKKLNELINALNAIENQDDNILNTAQKATVKKENDLKQQEADEYFKNFFENNTTQVEVKEEKEKQVTLTDLNDII